MKPKLRFKEFDEDWEEKKLGEISEINPKNNREIPLLFEYIDLESVEKGRLVKREAVSKEVAPSRAKRIVKKFDILYQTVRPYQRNNFIELRDQDNIIASTGYALIRLKKDNPLFLYQYLGTYGFTNKVIVRCTGTSYPAINSSDLKYIKIQTPSLPEQEKIGQFFSLLDDRIEKQEQKINLLKERKKGWMQKLFNQEIRFKDENGNDYSDWEEKKLGDIAKLSDGDWIEANHIFENGKYRIIQTGNIGIGNFIDKNAKYFHQEDFDELKANEIFAGDILISRLAEPVGRSIIVPNLPQRMVTAVDVAIIRPSDLFNTYYLVSYLNTNQNINNISILATGSTRKRISRKNLEKIVIPFPSLPEQEKIAGFLSKQDELIEQEEKKLELLKEQKKGLLQQMFV